MPNTDPLITPLSTLLTFPRLSKQPLFNMGPWSHRCTVLSFSMFCSFFFFTYLTSPPCLAMNHPVESLSLSLSYLTLTRLSQSLGYSDYNPVLELCSREDTFTRLLLLLRGNHSGAKVACILLFGNVIDKNPAVDPGLRTMCSEFWALCL